MSYAKINTKQDIIDCILSTKSIFSFTNKTSLTLNLNEIGFFEQEEHTHHDVFGSYFWFSGNIDNVPISLTITKQYNQDACILSQKFFYKNINGELHPHRDNDLPAYILNNTHTPEGEVCVFHYYIDGIPRRDNKILASCIEFEGSKTIHSYTNSDAISYHNILITSITCEKDKVIEIKAYYNDSHFNFKKLVEVIPRTKYFTLLQIAQLENELTESENTLLHMAVI